MFRVRDGHMGQIVHGHAEAGPVFIVDEVANDRWTVERDEPRVAGSPRR